MSGKWIIYCNVGSFDITKHFKENNKVVWKNSFIISSRGDISYIYLGRSYAEIKYKHIVISDVVDREKLRAYLHAIQSKNYSLKREKFIEMDPVCDYQDRTFKLDKLRENGFSQINIQTRVGRQLQQYLGKAKKMIREGELYA